MKLSRFLILCASLTTRGSPFLPPISDGHSKAVTQRGNGGDAWIAAPPVLVFTPDKAGLP